MPSFSRRSQDILATCHPDLQRLFKEVIKHFDCTVMCGERSEEKQDEMYRTGMSTVQYPNSKHNNSPSMAVDVAPYPISWSDMDRFYHFSGFVKATAISLGIKIRSGLDWDGDTDLHDQNFMDGPHYELVDDV